MTLPIILCLVFFALAFIHFNWVLGGEFGYAQSLPTNESGERVLNPKRIESAIVALGLAAFGVFYLLKSGLIHTILPMWIMQYGGWVISIIFILRAVGDFKYIGFFKSIRNTDFGELDTKIFSPLCLAIGVIGIIIQLS